MQISNEEFFVVTIQNEKNNHFSPFTFQTTNVDTDIYFNFNKNL